MPQFSTYWVTTNAPIRNCAPPSHLTGYAMQLYTITPELSKGKKVEMSVRAAAIPQPTFQSKAPHKNGILSLSPNMTNCILPHVAVGGPWSGSNPDGTDPSKSPSAEGNGDSKPPCTEGNSSSEGMTATAIPDDTRLVCPELAVNYSGSLLSSRAEGISTHQHKLEAKLIKLQQRLRKKQLAVINSHVQNQLFTLCNKHHHEFGSMSVLNHSGSCPDLSIDHSNISHGTSWLDASAQLHRHLQSFASVFDEEMTDVSSDDDQENDMERGHSNRCQEVKRRWEQARVTVGSQWVWLEHKIAELTSQICKVDSILQHRPTKEAFVFAVSDSPTYYACSNGTVQKGTGGSVPNNHKQTGANGFVGHHPQVPPLLLPDGVLGAKLQVKDLLCASLTRTFPALMEEEGYSAARTRSLERRVCRKLVYIPQEQVKSEVVQGNFHPHLSHSEDHPSRLWLDAMMNYIVACPPSTILSSTHKRRKCTETSERSLTLEYISSSVNSSLTDSPHFKTQQTTATLSGHPDTPTSSQPLIVRKKRVLTAPAFDIDNIVIPYSVAASTRPEKLEYKEIMTPSWRLVEASEFQHVTAAPVEPLLAENGDSEPCLRRSSRVGKRDGTRKASVGKSASEEEIMTDEGFTERHSKCEELEKKRFFNFVSGSQKKRRPMSSTSDGGIGSPVGVGIDKGKRKSFGVASPTCPEPECIPLPQVHPWVPRKFPLTGDDLEFLENPPPPPPKFSHAPSPLPSNSQLTVMAMDISSIPKPQNHNSSSAPNTPLSSPMTLAEEIPVCPQQWSVIKSHNPTTGPAKVVSTTDSPIILKLTKRS